MLETKERLIKMDTEKSTSVTKRPEGILSPKKEDTPESRLKSRKFWIAIISMILMSLNSLFGDPVDAGSIDNITYIILGYLGFQGGADIAKVFKKNGQAFNDSSIL